jgi:hypothetical protein
MRFYDVPVNQSVPTEANRSLTSYIFVGHSPSGWTNNELGIAWLEQVFDKRQRRKQEEGEGFLLWMAMDLTSRRNFWTSTLINRYSLLSSLLTLLTPFSLLM